MDERTDEDSLKDIYDLIHFKDPVTEGNAKIKACVVLSPAVIKRFLTQIGSA